MGELWERLDSCAPIYYEFIEIITVADAFR
jgi:hypothetical protein